MRPLVGLFDLVESGEVSLVGVRTGVGERVGGGVGVSLSRKVPVSGSALAAGAAAEASLIGVGGVGSSFTAGNGKPNSISVGPAVPIGSSDLTSGTNVCVATGGFSLVGSSLWCVGGLVDLSFVRPTFVCIPWAQRCLNGGGTTLPVGGVRAQFAAAINRTGGRLTFAGGLAAMPLMVLVVAVFLLVVSGLVVVFVLVLLLLTVLLLLRRSGDL